MISPPLRRRVRALPLVTVLCAPQVLAACQSYDAVPAAKASLIAHAPDTAAANTQYRIEAQDQLDISVFQVPSLNRAVQVDAGGRIDFPLIGGVTAAGRTARELESDIASRLGAKYIKSPQVSVAVKDSLGQRFTVDGAVIKPGVYVARGETTLLQAIAQAGGLGEVGDVDGVTIARVVDGQRQASTYSLKAIRNGQAADPQVLGRDTIVVGESATLNTLKFVRDMASPVVGVARAAVP